MKLRIDRVNEAIQNIDCYDWKLDDKNNLLIYKLGCHDTPYGRPRKVFYVINAGEWEAFRELEDDETSSS